jgi:hypothetical protein
MTSTPEKNGGTEKPTIVTKVPIWSNQLYCR